MNKIKSNFKKVLSYIAARRILRNSIIIVIILLPTGAILTNKYFKNEKNKIEKIEQLSGNKSENNSDVTEGTITTDVVGDDNISRHTLSDGFSTLPEHNNSNLDLSNSGENGVSSNISQSVDKSSITGMNLEILEGYEFNVKKDLQLQATDKDGSNISDSIIIEKNNVNTNIPGIYNVKARVRLSNGQIKEKEFTVTVKETKLNVSLESFKAIKINVKKGEKIGFDLDLKVSKKHITPSEVMINGKVYTLYKGNENIIDKITNTKNYKVFIDSNNISGVYNYNLEYIKMSNDSWVTLGENKQTVEVLKDEASITNFNYEEKSNDMKIDVKFDLDDLENTSSNLKLEFYKGENLLETMNLDRMSNYFISLPVNSNGTYTLKILSDINLKQNTDKNSIICGKEIFNTNINISNIDQTSINGNDIEIIEGQNFDAIKDLCLKATDIDGEDITHKIDIVDNIDVNKVEKQSISVSVTNKNGKTYTKEFYVTVIPANTSKLSLSRILSNKFIDNKNKSVYSSTYSKSYITGEDTEILRPSVDVTGIIKKADGGAPEGRIQVELPTAMSFTVDQSGTFKTGNYIIKNQSSVGISVSVMAFKESNINGGITIKPIEQNISTLDRSNLHLALVGDNKKYVDLGKPINNHQEILNIDPDSSSAIQLLGEVGKGNEHNVDEYGVSEDFTLVFSIKKN